MYLTISVKATVWGLRAFRVFVGNKNSSWSRSPLQAGCKGSKQTLPDATVHYRDAFAVNAPPIGGSALSAQLAQHEQVQPFHLVARPGCLAQELQARRHAGLMREAAHRNALAQAGPAEMGAQGGHHGFECDAVQRVAGLGRGLGCGG